MASVGQGRTRFHATVLWALAVIALTTGYYLSAAAVLDRNWLARAGCVVVVLGIWSGIGGVIEARLLDRSLSVRRRISAARLARRFRADPEERDRRLADLMQRFEERRAEIHGHLQLSIGLLEASLLVTGTLVWGFGDLLRFAWV